MVELPMHSSARSQAFPRIVGLIDAFYTSSWSAIIVRECWELCEKMLVRNLQRECWENASKVLKASFYLESEFL